MSERNNIINVFSSNILNCWLHGVNRQRWCDTWELCEGRVGTGRCRRPPRAITSMSMGWVPWVQRPPQAPGRGMSLWLLQVAVPAGLATHLGTRLCTNSATKPKKEAMEMGTCPAAAHRAKEGLVCPWPEPTDLICFSCIDARPRFRCLNESASDSPSSLPHTKFRSRQILEAIGYWAWSCPPKLGHQPVRNREIASAWHSPVTLMF